MHIKCDFYNKKIRHAELPPWPEAGPWLCPTSHFFQFQRKILEIFYCAFYHQNGDGLPGYTTRVPILTRVGSICQSSNGQPDALNIRPRHLRCFIFFAPLNRNSKNSNNSDKDDLLCYVLLKYLFKDRIYYRQENHFINTNFRSKH